MRVALFTDTFLPKVDGITTVICLLLDHLAERGVETLVFSPNTGPIERYNQTPVITAPSLPFPFYPDLKMALPTPRTFRELRAFNPDVIHFIHPSVFGLAAYAFLRQRTDWPALVSYHIDYGRIAQHYYVGPFNARFIEPTINFLTRWIMNQADYNLAPSRFIQQRVRDIGVTAEVGLWRRGVDTEKFNPRFASPDMRTALSGGHPNDLLLLYVGRISPEKRLYDLKAVLEQVPGTRLALVGDGPLRPELEKTFAGQPVQWMGYLQGEALSQAYASADVFVFPSALESFGLVVVEAMAAGLPVVASRVGGVMDVIAEGETGYTFAPGDVAGLVSGIRQIAQDQTRMASMRRTARAFAETQTWPAMMDEVIAHYARLAAKGSE
ncbi:MAG: glycosyltransferase family 1 protein [Anaerolineae bacterium]|nr:glycosyltransferase family 1 protein [Anaerolineae bacterium]